MEIGSNGSDKVSRPPISSRVSVGVARTLTKVCRHRAELTTKGGQEGRNVDARHGTQVTQDKQGNVRGRRGGTMEAAGRGVFEHRETPHTGAHRETVASTTTTTTTTRRDDL